MGEFYKKNKEIVDKTLISTVIVLLIYLFINNIFSYVAPFVFGFLLSLLLFPINRFLRDRIRLGNGISALLSLILVLLLFGFLTNVVISRILIEAKSLYNSMPDIVEYVKDTADMIQVQYRYLYNMIPAEFESFVTELGTKLFTSLSATLGSGLKVGSTAVVAKVPNFMLGFILSLISCYFFLKDKELIKSSLRNITPVSVRDYADILKGGILGAVIGYIKAQLTIMLIVGIIIISGLYILNAEYALLIGIVIAIVDAFPVFGSGFFLWPWALISLINGDMKMAIGLMIIYFIVQITRQLLEPKLVGKQIGIHPLLTLMSIYVGVKVFGALGIFLGPGIMIIIKSIFAIDMNVNTEELAN